MNLIKQEIEITRDQLCELYKTQPLYLNHLLHFALCYHCQNENSTETFKIILTRDNTITMEGKCSKCGESVSVYSSEPPDAWYKYFATQLQVEGLGGDHSIYLREMLREEKVRRVRKSWIGKQAKENPVYFQIHISLEEINPKIWRRLLILPSTALKTLHKIIQIAMGWKNYHLHQFICKDERYGVPWEEDPDGTIDYKNTRISDLLLYPHEIIIYEYDFGDGWNHLIKLEDILFNHDRLPAPLCRGGACFIHHAGKYQ